MAVSIKDIIANNGGIAHWPLTSGGALSATDLIAGGLGSHDFGSIEGTVVDPIIQNGSANAVLLDDQNYEEPANVTDAMPDTPSGRRYYQQGFLQASSDYDGEVVRYFPSSNSARVQTTVDNGNWRNIHRDDAGDLIDASSFAPRDAGVHHWAVLIEASGSGVRAITYWDGVVVRDQTEPGDWTKGTPVSYTLGDRAKQTGSITLQDHSSHHLAAGADADQLSRELLLASLGRLGKQTAGLATAEQLTNTAATSAFLPQLQPSGDVIVADQKRVAHAAPVNGATSDGRSMVMDGSTNYYTASANAIDASEAANGLTILARLRPSGTGLRTIIGGDDNAGRLIFEISSNKLNIRVQDGNLNLAEFTSPFTITNDQVTYVGLSVDPLDNNGTNLFGSNRDGVQQGDGSGNSSLFIVDITVPFYIGAFNNNGTAQNFYQGEIGDLLIFDGSGGLLSAGQLQAAINAMQRRGGGFRDRNYRGRSLVR